MFPLSCVSSAFPLVTFQDSLRLIKLMGFKNVDLACFEGEPHIQPSEITADPQRVARRAAEELKTHGLSCIDIFATFSGKPPRDLNNPEPSAHAANTRDFSALARFAQGVGAQGITILPGLHFPTETRKANLDRTIAAFQELMDIAANSGLRLSFEAHVGSVCPEPLVAGQVLDAVPGLTLTLDPSHFWVQGYDLDDLDPLLERTGHVQLRQANRRLVQCSAQEGEIEVPVFLRKLQRASYEGAISCEYIYKDWQNCKNVDVLSETLLLKGQLLASNIVGT